MTTPGPASTTPWKPPAFVALVLGALGAVLWIVGAAIETNYLTTLMVLIGLGLVVVAAIFAAMATALFLLGKLRWR